MAYRRDRENPGFDDSGVEMFEGGSPVAGANPSPMADGSLPLSREYSPDYVPGDGGLGESIPGVSNPTGLAGMGGESPRERAAAQTQAASRPQSQSQPSGGSTSQATPSRPSSPEPMAGSTSSANAPVAVGLRPFTPMTQPSIGAMATPRLRGLYGSAGGLQGGGLGVPMDPMSNQASDPIDSLIQMLTKGK